MASFGQYESNREISSGAGAEVLAARKSDDPNGPECVVKVYSLEGLIGDDPQTRSDLDPVLLGLSRDAASRIAVQKEAAKVSPRVAPVLDSGRNSRGVWYAAPLYPRTLHKIVAGSVALGKEGICRVVRSIAEGALALKKSAGRSHGNLKLSNVLLGGAASIRNADVVISDPLPGGDTEAKIFEQADLREIGRIIYQLVARREITDDNDWLLILPVAVSKEWTAIFGKQAERWVKLCNRLLDSNLAPELFGLETLLEELVSLEPKPVISGKAVAVIAAVVCLCGAAGYFVFRPKPPQSFLVITVNLPNAAITLDGAPQKPGKAPVAVGSHNIIASYPPFLADVKTNITVATNETVSVDLNFDYATVMTTATVADKPVNAKINLDVNGVTFETNVPESGRTFLFPPVGKVQFAFQYPKCDEYDSNLVLNGSKAPVTLIANLVIKPPPPPGLSSVTFDNLLAETKVEIYSNKVMITTGKSRRNTFQCDLPPGSYSLSATYLPNTNIESIRDYPFTVEDKAKDVPVPLQWASVSFNADAGDVAVEGSKWTQSTSPLIWKPGHVTLIFSKEGFSPSNVVLDLVAGQHSKVDVELIAESGQAIARSELQGVTVVDSDGGAVPLDTPVKMKPGSNDYTWRAHYDGLDDVTNHFNVKLRETTNIAFKFSYGTLDLTVAPANAALKENGGNTAAPPIHRVLKPGQKYNYLVESPGYDSTNFSIVLKAGDAIHTNISLLRPMVLANFDTDPRGGQVFLETDTNPISDHGTSLREGEYLFTAKYTNLDAVSKKIMVSNDTFHITFAYGTLVCTSSIPGADVLQGNKFLGVTPMTNYLPPSPNALYRLILGNQTNFISTNLDRGSVTYIGGVFTNTDVLAVPINPANAVYLKIKKFKDYWVGQYDVTQRQYLEITGTNPSRFNKDLLLTNWSPDLPVESVKFADAGKFCQLLTEKAREWLGTNAAGDNSLKGYTFALPSESEWREVLGNGKEDTNLVYFGFGHAYPQEVGRQGRNTNDIFDACGNIKQWLADGNLVAGFSFRSPSIHFKDISPGGGGDETIGFRVVLKPPSH